MPMTQERLEYQREYRKRTGYAASKKYMSKIDSSFDMFVKHSFRSLKSGAKARNLSFNLTKKQLATALKEATHCAKTGRLLEHRRHSPAKASVDRINSRYGYSVKNIQIVCQQYNYTKMDSTDDELMQLSIDLLKHNGYNITKSRKRS